MMRQFMITTFTDLILRVILSYLFAQFLGTTRNLAVMAGGLECRNRLVRYFLYGKWKPVAVEEIEDD